MRTGIELLRDAVFELGCGDEMCCYRSARCRSCLLQAEIRAYLEVAAPKPEAAKHHEGLS